MKVKTFVCHKCGLEYEVFNFHKLFVTIPFVGKWHYIRCQRCGKSGWMKLVKVQEV